MTIVTTSHDALLAQLKEFQVDGLRENDDVNSSRNDSSQCGFV